MKFKKTSIEGCYLIELEPIQDKRGFFSRCFCQKEFKKHDLYFNIAQANISFNRFKGTVRGMHYQIPPRAENKLVLCTKGSIYDVAIDIRKNSFTYKKWFGVKLTSKNHLMLYVPAGCAHGYQTLENNCEVFYFVSEFYDPELERGLPWDDPTFGIKWPNPVTVISRKDKSYLPFNKAQKMTVK
ncbi:MAG: dTDP-4-dehydrorhamnose 3,5-epimerase [Candidatus Hodarchaeales archaeon]